MTQSSDAVALLLTGLTVVSRFLLPVVDTAAPANELGDRINWMTLEDGYSTAKTEGKPLMLIIHKSWCGACKSLKPKIAESDEIFALSQKFVMVNTMDDDEPKAEDDRYTPDGGYIPRILFFDPEGELLRDEINVSGNAKFKYYYYDDESVAASMESVLDRVAQDGKEKPTITAEESGENQHLEL